MIGRRLIVLTLFAGALISAPPALAKDPITLRDETNDAATAPDITSLTIEDNDAGSWVFTVVLATMPDLQPDGLLGFFFDTDRNQATGGLGNGTDFMVNAGSSGVAQYRWDGTEFVPLAPPADRRLTGTGVLFTVSRADLGTDRFDLAVVSTRSSTEDHDVVPNDRPFSYPATIDRLEMPFTVLAPRAGAILDARLIRAVLSSGDIVRPRVRCTLKYRGKALKPLEGGCRWRIPRNLRRKKLVLTITLSYGATTLTRTLPVSVR